VGAKLTQTLSLSLNFTPLHAKRSLAGGAVVLLAAAGTASWYFVLTASIRAADLLYNFGHALAALAVSAAAHVAWELLLAAAGARAGAFISYESRRGGGGGQLLAFWGRFFFAVALVLLNLPFAALPNVRTAPLAPINYAYDWASVAAGLLLLRELGGLPWRHVRLKIAGAVTVFTAIVLALMRCVALRVCLSLCGCVLRGGRPALHRPILFDPLSHPRPSNNETK
jgi:hypothetical protein